MDLFNGRSRNPTLKLATDRAPTRDNALAQAREQRAKRELEQRQRRCATKIQAAFRGHLSRRATTRDLAARAARLCSPSADTAGSAIRELALLASFVHLNTMNLHTRQGPFASLAADASRLTRQLALAISSWRTSDEQLKVLGSKSSSTALLHAANACDDNVLADDALLDRWRRCVAHHVASVPLTLMSAELEQRIVTCFLNRFGWSRTAELQWLRDIVERDGVMLPSSLAAVLTVPARAEEALAFVAPSASVLRAAFLGLASDTNFTQAIVQDKALLVALLRIGTGMLDKDVLIALITFMDAQSSTLFTHLLTELGEPKSKQPGVRWVVEEGLSVLFDAVLPPQNVVAANFALSPLNSLCRALARPYAAHVSVSVKNRSQAVPYISALAYHRYGLINKLLGAIRATSRQWALKDRSGALVLGYPYMVVLFSHLCRAYLTTSDLEEFQTLIGGVETLRYLVHMLRDTVFLALYNGHAGSDASDTSPAAEASTLFVAASVQLLSMLHAADEPMGLMGPDDWLRKDFRPPSQVNVTLYDEVAAATRRYQSLAANPDGTSEDSDEDARRAPNVGHAPRVSANANNNENALSILHLAPFIVPFEHRVAVFATLLFEDRLNEPYSNREVVVRRGHEFMDTVGAINIDQHPREIMAVGNVRFVDALGRNEAGYGRGVFRDWLRATVENGFNVSVGLYREDHAKTLEPNPHVQSIVDGSPLPLYTALGLLLGRAIRDGVLVDVPLSSHVRNLILGRTNTIFDLRAYDAELYRHLTDLKNGRFSPEEVNSMGLTFTHVDNAFGEIRETPLKKNGAEVAVTPENVVEYVHLLTDFILNRRTARAVQAFRAGLHAAVPEHWLHFFDSREFLTLIRGQDDDHPLDVADWRKHTEYDGFTDQDPLAHIFWTAVERMTPQQQRQLLHFATSATRAPLLGFSQLHPRFRLLASQEDVAHLPTAATCFCTLRIPKYTSVDQALEKLVQAATNCTTFEMS